MRVGRSPRHYEYILRAHPKTGIEYKGLAWNGIESAGNVDSGVVSDNCIGGTMPLRARVLSACATSTAGRNSREIEVTVAQ